MPGEKDRKFAPQAATAGLALSIVPTRIAVATDPTLLERVLRNLLANALRYTLRGGDTLMYEATIEDKNVFTKPWKISMPIYRRLEKNVQLMEFKCVEFVEELMYGQYRKKP